MFEYRLGLKLAWSKTDDESEVREYLEQRGFHGGDLDQAIEYLKLGNTITCADGSQFQWRADRSPAWTLTQERANRNWYAQQAARRRVARQGQRLLDKPLKRRTARLSNQQCSANVGGDPGSGCPEFAVVGSDLCSGHILMEEVMNNAIEDA